MMVDGKHEAVTEVIVVDPPLLLPPPQPSISMRHPTTSKFPGLHTTLSPSADIAGLDA
jgi:hypothetical protein